MLRNANVAFETHIFLTYGSISYFDRKKFFRKFEVIPIPIPIPPDK